MDSCKEEERNADNTVNNLEEEVRDILTTLETDEKIGAVLSKKRLLFVEEIAEVLEGRQKDKLPVLRDRRKLLRLIKFWVNLNRTTLQRPMSYFMQELLLLHIGWE